MLRKIRITLAVAFYIAVTMLFLDFTGTLKEWLGWTAKMQFLPAALSLNIGVLLLLIALTLVLGRVYCSVICPMGVMQDIISWLSGRRKKKKYRFSYSPEKRLLRYGVLTVFIIAAVAGIGSLVALLAPYSSYGRIASNLLAPFYRWGNNLLALAAEQADSYAFWHTEVFIKSMPTFIIALLTFIIIGVLAWRNGRTYCNTICPVGTLLGLLSRFSILKPVINTDKCKNCGLCSRKCKAASIDIRNHQIDYSRCVACMDCIATCRHDALHLKASLPAKGKDRGAKDGALDAKSEGLDVKGNVRNDEEARQQGATGTSASKENGFDAGRRTFLTTSALIATTVALNAEEKKVDGGLAVIEDKEKPDRATPITPPGSWSARNFARHCTGCQLCVAECPNDVLRPSTSLLSLMQPEMSYERGYCRPECNRCSQVCPAGAIQPISLEDKSSTRIGHAVWVRNNCIPLTDGVSCGNCARHCPSGAILMVPSDASDAESPKIPAVNVERCIGCGACENLCPSRPFSAIYVEGHSVHSEM